MLVVWAGESVREAETLVLAVTVGATDCEGVGVDDPVMLLVGVQEADSLPLPERVPEIVAVAVSELEMVLERLSVPVPLRLLLTE